MTTRLEGKMKKENVRKIIWENPELVGLSRKKVDGNFVLCDCRNGSIAEVCCGLGGSFSAD